MPACQTANTLAEAGNKPSPPSTAELGPEPTLGMVWKGGEKLRRRFGHVRNGASWPRGPNTFSLPCEHANLLAMNQMTQDLATRLDAHQTALAERLLAHESGICLIHALPGAGKSTLLQRISAMTGAPVHRTAPSGPLPSRGPILVDLRYGSEITLPEDPNRLWIVAASPEHVREYSRLAIYGRLHQVGNDDLFLADSSAIGSGWPAIEAYNSRANCDRNTIRTFLSDVVLKQLRPDLIDLLQALALGRNGLADKHLGDRQRADLRWLAPLLSVDPSRAWRPKSGCVAVDLIQEILKTEPVSSGAAEVLFRNGQPDFAIRSLVRAGRRKSALDLLSRSGGVMFGHLHGAQAAHDVLTAFGSDEVDPRVLSLRAMTSMKMGQVGHAHRVLDQAMSNPEAARDVQLRLARLLMSIYDDRQMDAEMTQEYGALLAEVPPDAHLVRGAVYNIALDDQIRRGLSGEVEATASRALMHYRKGNAPYLAFYIHVHLALMQLVAGAASKAQPHLDRAAIDLAATPFDTPQDDQFLALLRAQVAYERGDPEPMANFAATAFEHFAFGELWPTIATQALAFGSEALLHLRGIDAAMNYLEGWRVQMWRTRRFRLLVEQREIILLQTVHRLAEARSKLEGMASRVGRVWIDSAGENLSHLRDPEDIVQALIWLRQHAFERPRDRVLAQRLAAMAKNPNLTWRQSRSVMIWQAWAERRQGRVGAARRFLAEVLETCTTRQCLAPVIEERPLVIDLLDDPRMASTPLRDAPIPRNLRTAGVVGAAEHGLSRQETRALNLIVEGCSNKEIAHHLGVSLPTVKFHLKNLFRKLGVSDRRAAVTMARKTGLVDH